MSEDEPKPKRRGPQPQRLKLRGTWEEAAAKSLRKKPTPKKLTGKKGRS